MNEQNILIVRCGEVALKGMNKPYFERMLVDRIRNNLKSFRGVDVRRSEGLIFVRADKALDIQAIIKEISKVFGVASISKAVEAPSELEAIGEEAVAYMKSLIEERGIHTFKVEAKRADKNFPVKSPEIGASSAPRCSSAARCSRLTCIILMCCCMSMYATTDRIFTKGRSRDSAVCRLEPTARG